MLAFALASWAALSVWLLAGRALHQRRYQGYRPLRPLWTSEDGDPRGGERAASVRSLLTRLPRRSIERLAADSGTPRSVAKALATHAALKQRARLIRQASTHGSERGLVRRIAALRILALADHPDVLRLLTLALGSGDRDVAGAAVSLLGAIPDARAALLLVGALRARLYPQSRVAARLDRFPVDIPHVITPLIEDGDPTVRYWGATLLARYAGAAAVAEALAGLAGDHDASVRKAAVESVGVVGGAAAVNAALRLLDDPAWLVRAQAARTLGDLKRHELAPRVAPLLADVQWWVRAAAMDALQAMGPAVASAVAPFLDHEDRFARNGAAEVLQNLGVLEEVAGRAAQGDAPAQTLWERAV
jgi:HEAT repeat protein